MFWINVKMNHVMESLSGFSKQTESFFDHASMINGRPYSSYKYEQVLVGTVDQKYCKGYNYYRDVKETTTTYAIKVNEPETCTNVSTLTWPTDTLSTRYEFLGFDWQCVGCETVPRKVWKKCTRKVGVVTSSNTVTTSGISVTCSEFETKKVQVFGTAKVFVDYDIIRTPVYRDVYKYDKLRIINL